MARSLNEQPGQAGHLARQLLRLDPDFTLAKFRSAYPGAGSAAGERLLQALASSGVPGG